MTVVLILVASMLSAVAATAVPAAVSNVAADDPILVGAGDISTCGNDHDSETAALIIDLPSATVFTTGDNVYPDGSAQQFADCYDPTWGQFKDRTRPSVGNHDYHIPGAAGYFDYFGENAGDPATGYYSYDLGGWHVVVLNSNCAEVGGCGRNSPQGQWLAADLAANTASCTVAYWHHPRFSSGQHGSKPRLSEFWDVLDEAGVSVALTGHDHNYERFAPQDANGNADANGIRQFVVGTGGASLRPVGPLQPNSEFVNDSEHGVLMLALRDGSYDWEFRSVPDGAPLDAGSEQCAPDSAPTDAAPVVSVTSPDEGSRYSESEPVTFTATAEDAEDGDVAGALEWTSSLDGWVGSGRSFATDALSIGTHVVTAEATDSAGQTGSASVTVVVEGATPPGATLEQTSVRVRAADAVPLDADSSWAAPPDTGADADMEERFRIRVEVAETAGGEFSGPLELQYRRNGGAWAGIPVAPDDSEPHAVSEVEIWNSTQYRHGDATGDLLPGSSAAFTGGMGLEDNVTPPIALQAQHTELEWTVKIRKFHEDGVNADGDAFEFRVVEADGTPLARYRSVADVSLVHPPGLIGGTHVENPQRIGPFADSNGNLYYVVEPTEFSPRMMMLKSPDGGETWLEVDRGNRPATGDLESVDIRQVGDVLHIAHQPGSKVVYHSFRMSGSMTGPDSWDVRDEKVDDGLARVDQATAIEVLSDGRIRVFYEATNGSHEALFFKTRSAAGVWDAEPTLLDAETVDWHWVTTVRADAGSNRDRIFVFYFENTMGASYLRTLDADGSLSSRTPLQTLDTGSSHRQPILPPVYWNEGGEDRVLVAYKKAGDTLHSRLISGTAVGAEMRASDQPADRNRGASRQPVADIVADGGIAHLLYADATSYDLWTDATAPGGASWGTDTELIDAGRVNWVRGGVFEHSGANGGERVYGFAYEDHDTPKAGYATGYIRYAELKLGTAPPPEPEPQPPTADAGADQTVEDSDGDGVEPVVLDASATTPGDNPIAAYEWYEADARVASAPTPTVDLDVGTHVLTLEVTDEAGLTDRDEVTVTVTPAPPPDDPVYYVSFRSGHALPGITTGNVRDEDIVAYDTATGTWSMYFDASDVGITSSDLRAFHIREDGSVLMSFASDGLSIPGLTGGPNGTKVDDSDIFLFTPTRTGEVTEGSFAFHFDGSDVGLGSSSEDIDALLEFPDGSLGVSTVRNLGLPGGFAGGDEDVYRFTGTFGAATAGAWSPYFDGSKVDLTRSSADLDAISLDAADLLFSTTGTDATAGGADEDISRFVGSYEPETAGTMELELDLSTLGIDTRADVDGLHYQG